MLKWYASGAGIARSGPYKSRAEAERAYTLTPAAREKQRLERGTECPYPYDLLVWQEKYEALVVNATQSGAQDKRRKAERTDEAHAKSLRAALEDASRRVAESPPGLRYIYDQNRAIAEHLRNERNR
jgi:hypothetical protein